MIRREQRDARGKNEPKRDHQFSCEMSIESAPIGHPGQPPAFKEKSDERACCDAS